VALSRDPIVCTGAVNGAAVKGADVKGTAADAAAGFAAGQVASRLSSAPANPSLENFAVCAVRRPSDP
jgi:hypothetical protein